MKLEDIPVYESALLLQGPVGPFFKHFSSWMRSRGSEVYKINFNLSDDVFYPRGAFHYKSTHRQFADYLRNTLMATGAKAVFMFGEHRPLHEIAQDVCKQMGVAVWVFEEGFIRPGYITLENLETRDKLYRGVQLGRKDVEREVPESMSHSYAKMVWDGAVYFTVGLFSSWKYPDYEHHKPFNLAQGFYWVRSALRRYLYRPVDFFRERTALKKFKSKFFLVPLQVYNDYAVAARSDFYDVKDFIDVVLRNFARHARRDHAIVLKHHPMDRGEMNYGGFISRLTCELGLEGRVFYLHDCHMPTFIKASRGVVLINSTVGYQAIEHGIPVFAMGQALYAQKGGINERALARFWSNKFSPDVSKSRKFISRLVDASQVPGSFYDVRWIKSKCEKLDDYGELFWWGEVMRHSYSRMSARSVVDLPKRPGGFASNAPSKGARSKKGL